MLLLGLRDVEVGDSPGAQRDRLLRTTVGGATIAIWHHTKQNNNSIKGTVNEWKRQRRASRLRCVVLPICNQWNKRLLSQGALSKDACVIRPVIKNNELL